tara:strand:- start:10621 stop:20496 length:9876 start_codon:yes stop_codon:yes gene_type:complete
MSIKKYFDVKSEAQSLANKSAGEISSQVESVGYHQQDIIKEERYLPQVDLSKPENFARYGSAEDYYTQAVKRIYTTYPYDGSLKERLEWENESTYVDLQLFENQYPRTNGYINFAADGWGTPAALYADGYGIPNVSADYEYIFFKGGPNANPDAAASRQAQFTGSNYYEPSKNRGSNLALNVASRGASVEFWLKKDAFDKTNTEKEVIFDLWNGVTSSAANYARLRLELTASERRDGLPYGAQPFLLTLYSGSTGFLQQTIASSDITTTGSVADGNWHHYAVTLKQDTNVTTRFYVDGRLNREQHLSASGMGSLSNISGLNLRAQLGSLIASPRASVTPQYAGKLSASLDEFRFWKAQRTSQEIGRFWFTQVGGGVNTDPEPFIQTEMSANLNLGVYFKFNEGITGIASTDSTVLDYSGRFSNGTWTGYTANARNTGSAIVISKAAIKEFKDPIIYSSNPKIISLLSRLQATGSAYDVNNNASIYNTMPSWIIEEDSEGTGELRKLTQIMASYFDTLHMQIRDLNKLKDIEYVSGSNKALPFADRLLSSYGFVAPEIFVDADILEKLADRSENKVYEKSLSEIKDTIYKNIYNNLTYIYKSKGTEKAFRNLIRCFGIDDELVKLNMYANDVEYEMKNDRRNITVADRFVNFNTPENQAALICNAYDSSNPNSVGFIPSSSDLVLGHAITMESEILFPFKPTSAEVGYVTTNTISASLFGVHGVYDDSTPTATDPTWASNDIVNFQVYAVRDEKSSPNVRFVVTSSGPNGKVPYLTSTLYEDVYNNSRWNLAVKIRPEKYPLSSFVKNATAGNYTIELHGIEADAGEILNEFSVSKTVAAPAGFITGSRRCYAGAHRTNFTGALLRTSDVKLNACRFWLDDLPNAALNAHALDTENYGALHPHYYAFPFKPSSSYGDATKFDTLVFNWEFLQNTGSDAAGHFIVADLSSGSATSAANANTASFGAVGPILRPQYPASGSFFKVSSTSAIDKDFIISSKLNLPENIYSTDMVQVLGAADREVFGPTIRPVSYFFAFEKSMYQVISEEIINYFANLRDFHNLIGAPVNQWRPEYKDLSFMRQKFFEKNDVDELDFDKFYEFYKWFDTSLSTMLQQLVPASADVAENVRTVIENHILERPKYQRKFPFLDNVGQSDISGSIAGELTIAETAGGSPEEFPQGSAFFTNTAFTKRQIGSSNPPEMRPWAKFHAPVAYPRSDSENNTQLYWERYLAERVDSTRQGIFDAIESTFSRRTKSPVKFGVEGTTAVGGVSKHHNSIVNYVFDAARAWGDKVPGSSNQTQNILVSSGSTVEELINTPEDFYPTFKQRLGFTLSGSDAVNHDAVSGPRHAPFSLYSSSVTDGYNAQVVANYVSGVMVTNLHNDFVVDTDIPMQGPFTQEYVGGRFYRHTRINQKGTDSNTTRAEGFRIDFDNRGSENVAGVNKKSLVILPPNAPHGITDTSLPTAYRFRDVTAKRPVNIKNIQMRTGSTIIGNYEKNYQVVNTNSRMKNDPFFNDQSFNFALYPETLATRGRFPLGRPWAWKPKSLLFDENNEYATAGSYEDWNDAIGLPDATVLPFSVSMWIKPTTFTLNAILWSAGRAPVTPPGYDSGRYIEYSSGTGGIGAYVSNDTYALSNTKLTIGTWTHVVVTFAGGTSSVPLIYFDKILQSVTSNDGDSPTALTTNGVRLGGNGTTSALANMCDVAVWNTALAADDVIEIYNDGVRFKLTNADSAANLISWWKLGDNLSDSATGTLYDEKGFSNATPQNMEASDIELDSPPAEANLSPADPYSTHPNVGGALNYALPARTGSASNQTVIVNRYAGSGYEVMSLGYMDPAHEELSVYNANPYHNLSIIDYGMSGSASIDPSIRNTIRVQDQINKPRGLDQRFSLHCGPFGSDAAYGSVPELTYVTVPSYIKTNRNRKRRMYSPATKGEYYTASVYDNRFVQHQIPRSEQQYAWVTASMKPGTTIFGLDSPASVTSSTLSQFVTASDWGSFINASSGIRTWGGEKKGIPSWAVAGTFLPTDFVGLNSNVHEEVTPSTHTLGYPAGTKLIDRSSAAAKSYLNIRPSPGLVSVIVPSDLYFAPVFNALILNRNGPYGWPTWKQIRAGESKVARSLRKKNLIGQVVPPSPVPNIINNVQVGSVPALKANTFVDYYESPVSSKYGPVRFYFEDNTSNSNPDNNVTLLTTYGNDLEYFTNDGLNNRLGLEIDLGIPTAFDTVRNFLVDSDLSTVVTYTESMYPAARNMYSDKIRTRSKYTIDNIWNPVRSTRSTLGGRLNVMGQTIADASIWPADAHNNYATTSSVRPTDGAGILMNSYSRYSASYMPYNGGSAETQVGEQLPAPTYTWRKPTGLGNGSAATPGGTAQVYTVLAGDTPWTAPAEANKDPYENYSTWAENLRVVGKNYSLVPEFRISEKLQSYYNTYSGDFLTNKLNDIYELTGTVLANSSHPDFFRTYTNTDFMKYFRAIDGDLNDTRSGDLKISRDRLKLKASGLIKFLPYKGFYPAERTAQLGQLMSQSYGSNINRGARITVPQASTITPTNRKPYYRMFLEPLMSPGILFNTIKSGIAVGSCVLVNTASAQIQAPLTQSMPCAVSTYPEGNVYYPYMLMLGTGSIDSNGYHIAKVPFEVIQDPSFFFSADNLLEVSKANSNAGGKAPTVVSDSSVGRFAIGRIFDTAYPKAGDALPQTTQDEYNNLLGTRTCRGANLATLQFNTGPYINRSSIPGIQSTAATKTPLIIKLADPEGGYRYAIDNFLCETVDFYLNGLSSFRSAREEQFATVQSGSVYTSVVRLYRSNSQDPGDSKWDMYSRASGFGFPLASRYSSTTAGTPSSVPTFSHVLPPYYSGEATARLIYTASYTGQPQLNEILSQLKISYYRDQTVLNYSASLAAPTPGITNLNPANKDGRLNDPRMFIDSSMNLKMKVAEVPPGTTQQQNYWLIQSKFETPVLNFANVSASAQPPPSIEASLASDETNSNALKTVGMWHQYGALITGSAAGVFATIEDDGPSANSLADIVGFPKGAPMRVGAVKPSAKLEEAIVAIPYKVAKNRRKFFKINTRMQDTAMYRKLLASMDKYVFPPKFDFTRHNTVRPVLTYVFEFSADITQQDIADMWQNLPPDIEERITEQEVIVEDRELLSLMASTTDKIEWMVFKVKKRAKRDFDKYKRSLVTADTTALAPKLEGPYTYNWPYDYFSLVELANIEATAQWTSKDMQYEISENDAGDLDGRPPTAGRMEIPSNPNASNRRPQPQPNLVIPARATTVETVKTKKRTRRSASALKRRPGKTRGGKS